MSPQGKSSNPTTSGPGPHRDSAVNLASWNPQGPADGSIQDALASLLANTGTGASYRGLSVLEIIDQALAVGARASIQNQDGHHGKGDRREETPPAEKKQ